MAALSSGGQAAKRADLEVLMSTVTDFSAELYTRGLAVASLGACLRHQAVPSAIEDLALMDGLIDMIGQTKSTHPSLLGLRYCWLSS